METGNQSSSNQSNPLVAKVKALLMRAWRERWNEVQWGVQLKRVMNSTPGDTKDLAELLLGQALVGTHPNSLIITYLKHSIFSQFRWIALQPESLLHVSSQLVVITASGALKYIIDFEDYNRPFCLLGLIDLAKDFVVNISNWSDGGLSLCKTMQNLLHWLLKVMLKCVQKFQDGGQQEYVNVLDAAATAVLKVTDSGTIRGVLYIARNEEMGQFQRSRCILQDEPRSL